MDNVSNLYEVIKQKDQRIKELEKTNALISESNNMLSRTLLTIVDKVVQDELNRDRIALGNTYTRATGSKYEKLFQNGGFI